MDGWKRLCFWKWIFVSINEKRLFENVRFRRKSIERQNEDFLSSAYFVFKSLEGKIKTFRREVQNYPQEKSCYGCVFFSVYFFVRSYII
jgi:hypothetical protein